MAIKVILEHLMLLMWISRFSQGGAKVRLAGGGGPGPGAKQPPIQTTTFQAEASRPAWVHIQTTTFGDHGTHLRLGLGPHVDGPG